MNVFGGIALAGLTVGVAVGTGLVARELLRRTDIRQFREDLTCRGTDLAERVGHLAADAGRVTGTTAEKLITTGGTTMAKGAGLAVGLTAGVAEKVLFVHHEPTEEPAEAAPEAKVRPMTPAARKPAAPKAPTRKAPERKARTKVTA